MANNIEALVNDIATRCERGGYMARKIHIYGYSEYVAQAVERWKDYNRCTKDTQSMLRLEIKGFMHTLEYWERIDKEGVELVGDYGGKIKVLPEEVEVLVNTGIFKRA